MKSKKTEIPTAESADTRSERDRFAVVLEALQTDFSVLADKIDLMDKKSEQEFREVKIKLDKIDFDIIDIKSEISDLKDILVRKADLDRLEHLEKRVLTLEKLVAAR